MTFFVIAFVLGAAVGGAFVHFTMVVPLQKECAGKHMGRHDFSATDPEKRKVAVEEVGELIQPEPRHEIHFFAVRSQYAQVYEVQIRECDSDEVTDQMMLSGEELMEFRKILDARDDWEKPQTTA